MQRSSLSREPSCKMCHMRDCAIVYMEFLGLASSMSVMVDKYCDLSFGVVDLKHSFRHNLFKYRVCDLLKALRTCENKVMLPVYLSTWYVTYLAVLQGAVMFRDRERKSCSKTISSNTVIQFFNWIQFFNIPEVRSVCSHLQHIWKQDQQLFYCLIPLFNWQ